MTATKLSPLARRVLPHVDNPANEDRWGLAVYIADRAGVAPRTVTPALLALQRAGLVESRSTGKAPSPFSDKPPQLWRTVGTAA